MALGLALGPLHGFPAAGRRVLEPIATSFTEGLDTPDVVGGLALLGTLR